MGLERNLALLARAQHGLVTRRQLLNMGVSSTGIDRRVGSGRLFTVYPEVFVIGGAPRTTRQELMAAVLALGRGAALSHVSAASLWGMLPQPKTIHVATPRPRWRRKPFVVHRSTDLGPRFIDEIDAIPVTTPARTIVDLGAVVGRRTVGLAFDAALRDRLVTLDEVAGVIEKVARRGRSGVGAARDLLEERQTWRGGTESVLEDLFRQLLQDAGLPLPEPQVYLRDASGRVVARVDFAYRDRRLVIELDGFRYHSDPGSFVKDRVRQNRVVSAGYRMLRYTAHDLREAPARVIAEVSRFLTQVPVNQGPG